MSFLYINKNLIYYFTNYLIKYKLFYIIKTISIITNYLYKIKLFVYIKIILVSFKLLKNFLNLFE